MASPRLWRGFAASGLAAGSAILVHSAFPLALAEPETGTQPPAASVLPSRLEVCLLGALLPAPDLCQPEV